MGNVAIAALNAHIVKLRQSRAQWDPNYVKNQNVNNINPSINQQPQSAVTAVPLSEEERMIQEAIRMSREQHVKDKIMEQQRLLDSAKSNRHINNHQLPQRG